MFNNFKGIEMHHSVAALKHKNFLIYWLSMCVSLIGTWMQNIAQPWLAYKLTNSAFLLGLVGAMQFIPMLLFSLFAGVIVDKFNRKKIILATQSSSAIITLILGFLVLSGYVQLWHILVAATLLGFTNTLDMPARQAFVTELVKKEVLMNAVALNSFIFNLGRLIGPALAGLAMGYLGIAFCFFANAISFLAVVIALFFIKPIITEEISQKTQNIFKEILEGLKYTYQNKIIFRTLLSIAVVATFAMNFNVMVPVFTKDIFQKGEASFGLLMSFSGLGSMLGAIGIAIFSRKGPQKFVLSVFPMAIGVMLLITGYANGFIILGITLALTGLLFVSYSSTANSIIQLKTDSACRGRVMSIYTLVFSGFTPFGNLYAGLITEYFGPRFGFFACGGIIVILCVLIYLFKNIKNL